MGWFVLKDSNLKNRRLDSFQGNKRVNIHILGTGEEEHYGSVIKYILILCGHGGHSLQYIYNLVDLVLDRISIRANN